MNRLKTFGLVLSFIAVIVIFGLGVFTLTDHYLRHPNESAARKCTSIGTNHLVLIRKGSALPVSTNAKLCDTLTIKNTDAQVRLMAFGEHDHHEPYDGVTEKVLDKKQSFTVSLNQAGSFKFHDHLDDTARGTFSVH